LPRSLFVNWIQFEPEYSGSVSRTEAAERPKRCREVRWRRSEAAGAAKWCVERHKHTLAIS